jgi:HPt (histidine-containing phosphotransfer) domain-containing protein
MCNKITASDFVAVVLVPSLRYTSIAMPMQTALFSLDLDQLRKMTGNDEDFIREVLGMVLTSGPETLQEIKNLYEKRDLSGMAKMVHRFKSSVSILGNANILAITTGLEASARDENRLETDRRYPEFLQMVDSILDQVRQELGGARAA